MKVIENLMLDHRIIEEMLDILESMCQHMDAGNSVDAEDMHAALEWIREFVDGWHLHKEEVILFPVLAKPELRRQDGAIEAMLNTHRHERHLLAGMARASSGVRKGKDGAGEAFCHSAKAYIKLITAHIQEEDAKYYRAIKPMLDEQEQEELWLACRKLEEEMGKQHLDKMMATLRRLSAAYPALK